MNGLCFDDIDATREPNRVFVPARRDVTELSKLADLAKVAVVSYNVLSQMGARQLARRIDDGGGGGSVAPAILTITARREKLLRCTHDWSTLCVRALSELVSYDADILCLQEVDDYDDWWAPRLTSAGYDSVFAPRPRSSNDGTTDSLADGLVTAFRRTRFQLFRSQPLDLNDVCERIHDANLRARAQQDNAALLLALQPTDDHISTALCVTNVQLAAGGSSFEPVRVLQTEHVCRALAVFNADVQLPVLLAGSFNALPSSDVYHVLCTGRRRPIPQSTSPTPVASDAANRSTANATSTSDSGSDSDTNTLPQVAPFAPSFGSGRTPRFDSHALNLDVCPRALFTATSNDDADAMRYSTLQPRGDRDNALVHYEQLQSAYAHAFDGISEPELTFASAQLIGTIDYIFFSAGSLAPFALLALPTFDELLAIGDDVQAELVVRDTEWTPHRPRDWRDAHATPTDVERFTGDWRAPQLFNAVSRPTSWLPNAVYPSDHLALACVFAVCASSLARTWR